MSGFRIGYIRLQHGDGFLHCPSFTKASNAMENMASGFDGFRGDTYYRVMQFSACKPGIQLPAGVGFVFGNGLLDNHHRLGLCRFVHHLFVSEVFARTVGCTT